MSQVPIDFLNILVVSPGDLLFFLAVVIISQAGLFMALSQRLRAANDPGAQRYTIAGIGITLVWALMMFGALFALLVGQEARVILPPLERMAQAVSILLLGWAFLTAETDRWGRQSTTILLILIAVVIVAYIITGVLWPDLATTTDFNLSIYGVAWALIPTVFTLLGLVLMLIYFSIVIDAPLKLVYFTVLLVGYGGTLFQMSQGNLIGDYSGLGRLAFLASLLIMPAVVYRMVIRHVEVEIKHQRVPDMPSMPQVTGSPLERESVQLLKALGLILENASPLEIPKQIVTATLEVLRADVGLLLKVQDANYADVVFGYDAVMGRTLSAIALNLSDQPTLVNAIERRQQRPLLVDRNVEELQDFYGRLDVSQIGPTYLQPLVHKSDLIGILIIGLPYAGREFIDAESERLKGIAIIASGMLALGYEANEARLKAEERAIEAMVQGIPLDEMDDVVVAAARQEMVASLELAREQIGALSQQVTQLKVELDYERGRLAEVLGDTQEGLSISQRMLALNDEQQKLRGERDELVTRLQEAETALATATGGTNEDVFNTLVEVLQREKDDLLAQRERLSNELAELKQGGQSPVPETVQEVLLRMSNEKAYLEVERDQLRNQLTDLEGQLDVLGIENGPGGLAQLVAQLHEQQAILQARYDALKQERDTLLNERKRFEAQINQEKERDAQLQALQSKLQHLAADNEAFIKQRERLRVERDELLSKLDAVKGNRAQFMAEAEGYRIELEETHDELAALRDRLRELSDQISGSTSELDRLQAEKQALENERDQLLARVEGDRDRLRQLGIDGVGSMTRMIEELTTQRNELERELSGTRNQLAAVEDQLEVLRVQTTSQSGPSDRYQPNNPELILGMVQELRTPMTSIVGYVDLLLSESAGILGEMQRRFLQRVSANIARLSSMLDDLNRITALDTGQFALVFQPVDVIAVLEDTITGSSGQFREKELTVHLNLDDEVSPIQADADAISQIIGQLLTNAYLVSPPGSEVIVSARQQFENLSQNGSKEYADVLFVSIEDRGGGIALEDQSRVFARKYKAENPLIQGLGDTGVGLSIAKALVEAHGGRLWLETEEGVGSAFKFILPVVSRAEQVEG